MTNDYSLHDLAALLAREGRSLRNIEISVVLSRLKARGEIEEIRPSAGPKPALFRRRDRGTSPEPASTDTTKETEFAVTAVAVQ
jgi:hypothetical protein